MAKRQNQWSEDKLKRYIKEGRGQGEGKEYKPWKFIQDFPSIGRCSRLLGWRTNRVHHLFSDIETRFFYLMDWEEQVVDIRESYPLLDLDQTIDDTDDLRLDLFKDKDSNTPYILTTSFLITLKENDNYRYIARSIKSASELDRKISLEKYEIEKRYWGKKNIDWGIITQKEIPLVKAKNIEWIHSALSSAERGFSDAEVSEMGDLLVDALITNKLTLRSLMSKFDNEYNLPKGSALFLFKYLIASKIIAVDMDKEIDINATGKDIILEISNRKDGRNVASS
jgi:hypothetical protein